MSPTIQDIPIEVFLDHLLPIIDIPDLLSLASTNKFFAILCADDTFWKIKLKNDLNYVITDARDKGFKVLYRGIRRPRVYVWGSKGEGRLGLPNPDSVFECSGTLDAGVPFPVELPFKDTRIVSITAGGWSFAALDEAGRLHVWGRLDAENGVQTHYGAMGESGHQQRTPATLEMPHPIISISSGRRHLLGLDRSGEVSLFNTWGHPARLISQQIKDQTSKLSRVVQAAAGWDSVAILTESGHVFVEWPFDGAFGTKYTERVEGINAASRGEATMLQGSGDVLKLTAWDFDEDLVELPEINFELLPQIDSLAYSHGEDVKVVKIAAGDGFLVALTNHGHVLKIDIIPSETILDDIKYKRIVWKYLPNFSEPDRLRGQVAGDESLELRSGFNITHISATFRTFVAYSVGETSVVLIGDSAAHQDGTPTIIPKLQNRNVVSVVLGDYHFAALTEDGNLLTWGKYSDGALGLGDPRKLPQGAPGGYVEKLTPENETTLHRGFVGRPRQMWREPSEVKEPSIVRFDHQDGKPDKFIFAVAASGWHTAALAIDMEPSAKPQSQREVSHHQQDDSLPVPDHEEEHDAAEGPSMPGAFLHTPRVRPVPGQFGRQPIPIGRPVEPQTVSDEPPIPPGVSRGLRGIRLGYAARGAYRGNGVGRVLAGGFRGLPRGRGGPAGDRNGETDS